MVNMTMTTGFKSSEGKNVAILAPPIANKNTNGNNFPTIFKSTFPERKKRNALVKDPNALANLFVPNAVEGGIPTASNAGMDIKPPPSYNCINKCSQKTKKDNDNYN